MAINTEDRLQAEERMRKEVYDILDAWDNLWDEELFLWQELHSALEKIALLYDRHGCNIWKH